MENETITNAQKSRKSYEVNEQFVSIGGKLKRHREDMGYSLSKLCGIIDVSPATISMVEHGKLPRPSTFKKLADALGIDIETRIEYGSIPQCSDSDCDLATFGGRLQACIRASGLGFREVNEMCGIDYSCLSRYASNDTIPSAHSIKKILSVVDQRISKKWVLEPLLEYMSDSERR